MEFLLRFWQIAVCIKNNHLRGSDGVFELISNCSVHEPTGRVHELGPSVVLEFPVDLVIPLKDLQPKVRSS